MRYWGEQPSFSEIMCQNPFNSIEILPRGEVYTCCSASLQYGYYLGNIYETDNFEQIWNGERAKKLRYSVTMGNFEYCNRFCKWLSQRSVSDPYSPLILRNENYRYNNFRDCSIETPPKYISLCCDESCNLTCRSCRSKLNIWEKDKSEKLYSSLMKNVFPLLDKAESLSALGSGEFFASFALQKFFKVISKDRFPNLSIFIITNGQLFTKKKWEECSNLHEINISLAVSVDAASKKTYEYLRRGASWDILCENLKFISQLRRVGKIKALQFNFVVQSKNYKEITDFVEFAHSYSVDSIEFQRLSNWGTFTSDIFNDNDMLNPTNPNSCKVHEELVKTKSNKYNIRILTNTL